MTLQRKVIATIGEHSYASYLPTGRGTIDPRGFRIDFEVERGLKNGPDTTQIVIYNPDLSASRAYVTGKGRVACRLYAGYDVPPTLYSVGTSIKNGIALEYAMPDFQFRVQFADGIRKYQTGRVAINLRTATNTREIIERAAAQLGVAIGAIELDEIADYPRGYMAYGAAREVFDEIARAARCDWTFQGGKLVFLGTKRTIGTVGRKFSYSNGTLLSPPEPMGASKFRFKLDFDANMAPGVQFAVDAEQDVLGTGYFKATSVRASGSSYTGEMTCTVEARLLKT